MRVIKKRYKKKAKMAFIFIFITNSVTTRIGAVGRRYPITMVLKTNDSKVFS